MALAAVSLIGGFGGLEVFICSPLLSEGVANAPIAGHSLTDLSQGESDEHLGGKGIDQRRLLGSRRPLMMTVPSLMMCM